MLNKREKIIPLKLWFTQLQHYVMPAWDDDKEYLSEYQSADRKWSCYSGSYMDGRAYQEEPIRSKICGTGAYSNGGTNHEAEETFSGCVLITPPPLFLIVMLNLCIGCKMVIVLAVGVTLSWIINIAVYFSSAFLLAGKNYLAVTSLPWLGLASTASWIS